MDSFSTQTLFAALAVLLLTSAFFSASETAMMAINRYRLRHAAESGVRGAIRAQALLDRTDKLLGVILLGNNLVNAASGTLSAVLAIRLFGDGEIVLFTATLLLTFAILVFSEVTPKVMGASYPERIAYPAAFVLTPLLKLAYPVVWFVNLFVQGILRLLRIRQPEPGQGNSLGLEELRTIVLESSGRLPREHHRILVNLLELEGITVDDVMTPRSQIEAIEISENAVALFRERFPEVASQVKIHVSPVEEIVRTFADNSFDVVFTMAVLEHIPTDSAWVFDELARIAKTTLITIEDEKGISWRHFPRNYREIFEPCGLVQVHEIQCEDALHGLGNQFFARVFKKG